MTDISIIVRILVAAILGAAVGLEREVHGRAAGLRTHILVCVGSALFMVTSILMSSYHGPMGQVDPSRIAAGVVTGIGFLGAGAIIRSGSGIRGLTTAASIWVIAAIGIAAGAGMYVAAIVTTAVVVVVLFLSRIEEKMELKSGRKQKTVTKEGEI